MKNTLLYLFIILAVTATNAQTEDNYPKNILNASTVYTGITWDQIFGPQEYIKKFATYDTYNLQNIFQYPFGVIRSYSGGAIDPNNPRHIYTITYVHVDNENVFCLFDLDTKTDTQIGIIDFRNWKGLSFDPTSGILYGITTSELYSIDPITAVSTLIGPTMINANSLAIDGNGQMYSCDISTDNFYSLNKNSGESTLIGTTGIDVKTGSMAWDPNTDNIYLISDNHTVADFRIIDKISGISSLVGTLYRGFEYNDLYYSWIAFDGTALGLNSVDNLSFKIFPNPANNILTIQSKMPVENVKIYTAQGVLVNEVFTNNIDLSGLSAGIYFVEVTVDGKSATKKFIKI